MAKEDEAKLTAEELLEKANEGLKKVEEEMSSKASAKDLEDLKKKNDEILTEIQKFSHVGEKSIIDYVKELQEQANANSTKLDDILEGKGTNEKSSQDQIAEALRTDVYKQIAKQKGMPDNMKAYTFDVVLKANEVTSSNLTETNDQIPQTQRLAGDIIAPRRPTLLYDLFPKAVATSDLITWVELTSETSGAAATSEGGTFGQSYMGWTSYKQAVEKITAYVKVSHEMLEDVDFVQSRINECIGYYLADARETELLTGSGTSPHLKGIDNHTKTFSLSDFDGVASPNNYDAIMAVLTQINLGNTSNSLATGFMANNVILNPVDHLKTKLEKDSNGNYIIPPSLLGTGFSFGGANILQSQRIGAGYYLGGDFTRGTIYIKRNLEIKMYEQNEDDAIKDYITITASQRLSLVVSNIDAYAFGYDTIANAINGITAA